MTEIEAFLRSELRKTQRLRNVALIALGINAACLLAVIVLATR